MVFDFYEPMNLMVNIEPWNRWYSTKTKTESFHCSIIVMILIKFGLNANNIHASAGYTLVSFTNSRPNTIHAIDPCVSGRKVFVKKKKNLRKGNLIRTHYVARGGGDGISRDCECVVIDVCIWLSIVWQRILHNVCILFVRLHALTWHHFPKLNMRIYSYRHESPAGTICHS